MFDGDGNGRDLCDRHHARECVHDERDDRDDECENADVRVVHDELAVLNARDLLMDELDDDADEVQDENDSH